VYAPDAPLCLRDWSHRHASIGRSSRCTAFWFAVGDITADVVSPPYDWLLAGRLSISASVSVLLDRLGYCGGHYGPTASRVQTKRARRQCRWQFVGRPRYISRVFLSGARHERPGNWWIAALVLFQSMPTTHGAPETIDCVFIPSCRALQKNTTNDTTVHWPVRYSSTLKAVHLFAWDRNSLFSHQTTGNLSGCLSTKRFPIDSKLHHASDFLN